MTDKELIKLLLSCIGFLLVTGITLIITMRKEILGRLDKIENKMNERVLADAHQDEKIETMQSNQNRISKQLESLSIKASNMLSRLIKIEAKRA